MDSAVKETHQLTQRRAVAPAAVVGDGNSSSKTTSSKQPEIPVAAAVEQEDHQRSHEGRQLGKTPGGQLFVVPETHSFIHHLFSPFTRKSHLDYLTLFMLGSQCLLFFLLPLRYSRPLFLFLFVVFRLAYNVGLGWILRKQSTKRFIVREITRRGWLDATRRPAVAAWCKRELEGKVGESYSFEKTPVEFTVWLLFRQVVDVILLNDFVSYSWFAWSFLSFPSNQSILFHALRWVGGWTLIAFNVWVKVDAHRVVKDYAWYWGDAFFGILLEKDLIFDGVYNLAPHPMYSVGYAGFYGLSIVVASWTVLYVSIAAHLAQFGFLLWFENPHIERVYGGGQKPLASRVPLAASVTAASSVSADDRTDSALDPTETPAITEGETASETELESDANDFQGRLPPRRRNRAVSGADSLASSGGDYASSSQQPYHRRAKMVSLHDLTNRYFRKDVVVLQNMDLFRATDFSLVLLLAYAVLPTFLPVLSPTSNWFLAAYFAHALAWRLFHSFGLGIILKKQSENRWFVRHFVKHYHYPSGEEGAVEEAFANWKVIYNLSLCMTYVSFISLAWKTYRIPSDWTVGGQLLRHTLGCMLIALHIWTAVSTFEVLGTFGWLYSDFFLLGNYPAQLAYTGIYRFLNNPERSMGGAAFFGLALISGSKLVFTLAVISSACHWWFLSCVESPHMRKVYGDAIRKDAGVTQTIKTVVDNNAKHFQRSDIKRVVSEVRGTIGKVDQRIQETVDDFFENARPRLSEVVQDTKFLLQQSRERLVITRVANVSDIDVSQYHISLVPSAAAASSSNASSSSPSSTENTNAVARFHIGEPIKVKWEAPATHSRKDWIGIYRLGACKSQFVTRISSVGKWAPLHDDEYDGDKPIARDQDDAALPSSGTIVLKGDALPWQTGQYELRYHHDGKHNVMTRLAPIEIFVPRPSDPISLASVHSILSRVVALALDSDPALIPASARPLLAPMPHPSPGSMSPPVLAAPSSSSSSTAVTADIDAVAVDAAQADPLTSPSLSAPFPPPNDSRDPEDFTIMTTSQAKRMVAGIKEAFDVDYAPEVVIADPNVLDLARKVVESWRILGLGSSSDGGPGGLTPARLNGVRAVGW